MSTIRKFFTRAWDEGLVYLVTVAGVILSQNQDKINAGAHVQITIWQTVWAAFLAIVICYLRERDGAKASPESVLAGKRRNIWWRLGNAALYGYMSPTVIKTAIASYQAANGGN